ncbi:MAG: hypothetical protein H0V54_00270 [Chthoniobacterales bacterium]|nr:hypothetical protein [Chthoniobacterales bacterium]
MSFISTGLREMTLKVRRQKTRMALKHEKRLLQKSEIALGREGTAEAAKFPEVRNEIVALKKLEQEQKEVAGQIAKIEEALKQIDAQRQENSKEQAAALARLEEETRSLVEERDAANATAERCGKELATVDRRLSENDAADRELLKKVSTLQETDPPPADLAAQLDRLSSERARLPREKNEMSQARLGSADACRKADEKLKAAEVRVAQAEKNSARVRAEFEARDRDLNEGARAQQEEVKEARQKHQTVEEKKNPAYLNIGRHLASQGIAPPSAPHLLTEVQQRRAAVDRHAEHKKELAELSGKIDKQELRKFYFAVFSLLALLAIILPLVSKSPTKRDWLPRQTVAILSLDIEQFNKGALTNRWRKEQAELWQKVATGLLGPAARTPALNLAESGRRVTRAFAAAERGPNREYVLVEARGDLAPVVRNLTQDDSFTKSTVTGLVIWQRPDVTVARVGPKTLAVGSLGEVDKLVQVRLGTEPDLKITDPLLDLFQTLDPGSALRLVARIPSDLTTFFSPILPPVFLEASTLLGLEMSLATPSKGHLVVRAGDAAKAKSWAASLQNEPTRWLAIPGSDFVLATEAPKVEQKNEKLDLHFDISEGAARLLLQRLAKVQGAPAPTPAPAPVPQ